MTVSTLFRVPNGLDMHWNKLYSRANQIAFDRIMFLKDDPKDFNYITVHILEFAHLNELICHYICYGALDKCLHSQGPRSLTIM